VVKKICVLLIFDEVQVSERFITSLEYFYENGAGSLSGVKLNCFQSSFPVGKVQMKYMFL